MPHSSLKICAWPKADQELWQFLTTPGSLFDDGGELAKLSTTTLKNILTSYGRWLSWLAAGEPRTLEMPPLARITAERVAAWLKSTDDLAPYSQKLWLDGLIRLAIAASPRSEIGFLREYQSHLLQLSQDNHGSRKIGRAPSSFDLIAAARELAEDGAEASRSAFFKARNLRDATMVMFLAMVPIRRKNFVHLEIGRTLLIDNGRFSVLLPASEVKNHVHYEIELLEPGASTLNRYLTEARPFLANRSPTPTNMLWLADTGLPYSYGYIGTRIPLIVERLLGIKVPPHFFRDAVATTFARTSPELARGTKAILGHTDHKTAERYYNQARSLEAGRTYSEIVELLSNPNE
jgi:integrase/recombinase XerD